MVVVDEFIGTSKQDSLRDKLYKFRMAVVLCALYSKINFQKLWLTIIAI